MGRVLLYAAAALLATTAVIHAMGQPMVVGCIQGLEEQHKAAICLVWLSVSVDWLVAAALWGLAGWKQRRSYLVAAAIAVVIPLGMAVGIIRIEPSFFGGWMLFGSIALAVAGMALSWRQAPA